MRVRRNSGTATEHSGGCDLDTEDCVGSAQYAADEGGEMTAPKLPDAIVSMMAQREARQHHYVWHNVRNLWLTWDESTRQKIRDIGWEPPRPARDAQGQVMLDNDSGEDFLYMHRQMIASVDERLAEINQPDYLRVEGWPSVPSPCDPDYPVPPVWDTGDEQLNLRLQRVKSEEFFDSDMRSWELDYMDPANLTTWSLGELGARVEFTIHNTMHMRWSANPGEIRPDVDPTRPDDIDPRWDNVTYDWLGDTYSSHVNPIFWKLHGWVDDRIEDWKKANGVTEIQWKGTWVGKMPEGHEHERLHLLLGAPPGAPRGLTAEEHQHHGTELGELVRIIAAAGRFHHLYDQIELTSSVG
jgi:hypothetical protein